MVEKYHPLMEGIGGFSRADFRAGLRGTHPRHDRNIKI